VAHAGKEPTSKAETHAGTHGAGRYFFIWVILLVMTVLTVWTGYKDLGAFNLPLAMTIASIKATLVILFFMHMTEAAGANRLVFSASFVFLFVMIIGVFGDLWTRNPMTLPSSAPSTEGPEIEVIEAHPGPAPAHH
jgi:cytochrome c oxidase subunit IV